MARRSAPTLNVPPFPELRWNGYFWRGRVVLRSWRGFQTRLGGYGAVSSPQESDGTASLSVKPPQNKKEQPPTAEQGAAFRYLLDHEEAIRDAVLRAIFTAYPAWREEYGFAEDEGEELMPVLEREEQLRALLGLSIVHVLAGAKEGAAYVGFELGCTWEEEHGLGVLTHKERVVTLGHADVSFDEYAAKHDAKPPKPPKTKKKDSGPG
jgi:hypothetical protein